MAVFCYIEKRCEMPLTKSTDLGDVKISEQVIAKIISGIISEPDFEDRIWPATVHGREIGLLHKIVGAEFASNIFTETAENGTYTLEFSVIVKFGESLKRITKDLSDRISESLEYVLGEGPAMITVNIAGVRSKHIARRNIKAVYRYGTD